MIRFSCPTCETNLKTSDDKAGTQITCPECRDRVTVPAAAPDKNGNEEGAKPARGGKTATMPRKPALKAARKNTDSNKGLYIGIGAVVCLLVAGGGIFAYLQFSKDKDKKEAKSDKPAQTTQDQTGLFSNNPAPSLTSPSDVGSGSPFQLPAPGNKALPADAKPMQTPIVEPKPDKPDKSEAKQGSDSVA